MFPTHTFESRMTAIVSALVAVAFLASVLS